MRCAVDVYETPDAIPSGMQAAFAEPGAGELFDTRAWYETVIRTGLAPGATACFAVAGDIVLPMVRHRGARSLDSLTTPYTGVFAPLVVPGASTARLADGARALALYLRRWGAVRLDAMAERCAPIDALLAAARSVGVIGLGFAHFGNWFEPTRGVGWSSYLQARDGALRETVRRKLRRTTSQRFELVTDESDVARGIAAYESVYGRSWKVPEPFPDLNPELMRVTARLGLLRLGLLHGAAGPVAAQFWVVSGGRALLLKLAHDEARRSESPGTVLTATMIRHLLDVEAVAELDFGRGDDAYKRLWTGQRRQRVGVVLATPWRANGAAVLARHAAGRLRRTITG